MGSSTAGYSVCSAATCRCCRCCCCCCCFYSNRACYCCTLLPPLMLLRETAVSSCLLVSPCVYREDGPAVSRLIAVYLSVFRRLSDFGVSLQSAVQEAVGSKKPAAAAAAAGDEAAAAPDGPAAAATNKRQLAPLPPLYLAPCCNRLVRVMLAGLLRALPFVSPDASAQQLLQAPLQQQQQQQQQQKQQQKEHPREGASAQLYEVLFGLAHTLPCVSSRILAMRILHSLTVLYQ